ncbi:MAG: nitroreductase family protein [Spirochaetes bacterium]|nr:nitroreductase family protein [Spirochaetota bacterium]
MNLITALQTRRSYRSYQAKDVTEEMINQVIELARNSPSWANTQCWEVIIVKDQAIKNAISETVPSSNAGNHAIKIAPVTIVLCGKMGEAGFYKGKEISNQQNIYLYDLGIFSQSLNLACLQFGLGTVTVGVFDAKKVKTILAIPEDYEVVTLHPIGFIKEQKAIIPKKAVKEFVHHDQW